MGLILRLSLRNLLRQKKRNLLLGLGIAFGMMVLVIASSFSHGMVDVLIEDIASTIYGQLVIDSQAGKGRYSIVRDKQRLEEIIQETIKPDDLVAIDEKLTMVVRAVGNGETDNVVFSGVTHRTEKEQQAFFTSFLTLVEGDFKEFSSTQYEYPVIISQEKAKSLNVKVHDEIRIRMPMITGQIQAAKLTVIAIAKTNNAMLDMMVFMDGPRMKELMGYKPWEAAALKISLKNPKKTAQKYADLIHQKLEPEIISIAGTVNRKPCQLVAFKNNAPTQQLLQQDIRIIQGDPVKSLGKDGVMLDSQLARQLRVTAGDEIIFQYSTKYRGIYDEKFEITAIYDSVSPLGANILLVNEERIHDLYNRYLPVKQEASDIAKLEPLVPLLATEWKLLERSADQDSLQKKYRDNRKLKTDQNKLDVVTMYEGASEVLKLEDVLNLVTVVAVLVLFFIILIGVINTLRMTIRERTREIGTIRAVGMQKKDVRNMFLLETLLLTLFSCGAGLVLGIIAMQILGTIRFDVTNALSIILKNNHLHFKINPLSLLSNFILIMLISGVTAYFPAQGAARLTTVEALRHYE